MQYRLHYNIGIRHVLNWGVIQIQTHYKLLLPLVASLFSCLKLNFPNAGFKPGVTGQSTPAAGIYPGLKQPRLDDTRVYYGLGQFIPQGIL